MRTFNSNYGKSKEKYNQLIIQDEIERVLNTLKKQMKGSKLTFMYRKMKRVHGNCRKGIADNNGYRITLNLDIDPARLTETIIHEIAHAQAKPGDKQHHGKNWQKRFTTLLKVWNRENPDEEIIPSGRPYNQKVAKRLEQAANRKKRQKPEVIHNANDNNDLKLIENTTQNTNDKKKTSHSIVHNCVETEEKKKRRLAQIREKLEKY